MMKTSKQHSTRPISRRWGVHFLALTFASSLALVAGGGCSSTTPPVEQLICGAGQTECGGACVDLQSDGLNCGQCTNSCTGGLKCSAGVCSASCGVGLSECGTSCVDPLSNLAHCGSCNVACGAGEACLSGVCGCPAGEVCGGTAVGGSSAVGVGGALGVGGAILSTAGGSSAGGAFAAGGATSAGGASSAGGATASSGGATASECTNVAPPPPADWPEATCELWARDTGECSAAWMIDDGLCNQSCGRCDGTVSSSGGSSGNSGGSSSGGSSSGGSSGGSSSGGSNMGSGSTYPPLNGEQVNHSTRYWDCCKPSCGWTNAGNIHSCSKSSGTQDIGVNDQDKSVCDGGNAQTCHGMAPWSDSGTDVAYGYAAANGRSCGSCYQLQFTGEGEYNANDPGSKAISGKTMIVMVTNTGGELGDGHFDLLIPGGGLGRYDGCSSSGGNALNVNKDSLGANEGGLITQCNGDLGCVRDKCNSTFANHPDLKEGCLWSVDWFKAADNPRFQYKAISCPSELSGFN